MMVAYRLLALGELGKDVFLDGGKACLATNEPFVAGFETGQDLFGGQGRCGLMGAHAVLREAAPH